WRVYTPLLREPQSASLKASNIELVFREDFDAETSEPTEFYDWLDRILFRENSLPPTSAEICRDFGTRSHAFAFSSDLIEKRLVKGLDKSEIRTAYATWDRYLKYTYGNISGSRELFVKHTYLSVFTKLLMAHVLAAKRRKSLSLEEIPDVVDGSYFERLHI